MRIEAADALVRNQWAVKAGETKAQVRMGNKSPEEQKDPLLTPQTHSKFRVKKHHKKGRCKILTDFGFWEVELSEVDHWFIFASSPRTAGSISNL